MRFNLQFGKYRRNATAIHLTPKRKKSKINGFSINANENEICSLVMI
jgi:hypothetical protein